MSPTVSESPAQSAAGGNQICCTRMEGEAWEGGRVNVRSRVIDGLMSVMVIGELREEIYYHLT